MQTFDTTTIEGRHELYKAMLAEVDKPRPSRDGHGISVTAYGFCFLAFYFKVDIYWLGQFKTPELFAKKPNSWYNTTCWFKPGEWKKRRAILVQCIEETHRAFTISTDNNDTPVT